MVFQSVPFLQSQNTLRVEVADETFYYHAQPIDRCLAELQTSRDGLTTDEVLARQKVLNKDQKKKKTRREQKAVFLKSFKNVSSYLLLAASIVTFLMGNVIQGVAVLVALFANMAVQGFIEWLSQKKHADMEAQDKHKCEVIREGKALIVTPEELVPGDILKLDAGQAIPADARLIESENLQLDESLMTGESILVPKNATNLHSPADDESKIRNMVFSGTRVKTGSAKAVVTAVGADTRVGQIAYLSEQHDAVHSSLTQDVQKLYRRLMLVVFIMTALVMAIESFRNPSPLEIVQYSLIMIVAALPATLPAISSLVLSLGLRRLFDQKIWVKNLQTLETVGNISVVCTDKTGTLTENYMLIDRLYLPELGDIPYDEAWKDGKNIPYPSVAQFLRVARLNNSTELGGLRSALMGDPIDVALYQSAPSILENGYRKKEVFPFDPVQLISATICETPEGMELLMMKGAPEAIMARCKYFMRPDGSVEAFNLTNRSEISVDNKHMASANNFRVIGVAQKPLNNDSSRDNTDGDLYRDAVFIGWVFMRDPAKPGVVDAINTFHQIGINVAMITGDQKETAETTARELDIMKRGGKVWTRAQLEECNGEIPEDVVVFARTKPEEKLYIVESLQNSGHIVAMVGDGVNDSPALKRSDIGIAMGYRGAYAAKENADIILMEDHLKGIPQVVQESRLLRYKLKSCMLYLTSCSFALLFFSTTFMATGYHEAVNIVQLLWLNLLLVVLPTLTIGLEPSRRNFLTRPDSMRHQQSMMGANQLMLALYWSLFVAGSAVITFYGAHYLLGQDIMQSATLAFCAMAFGLMFNMFNIQFYNAGGRLADAMDEMARAPITWIVLALTFGLQVGAIYIPMLQDVLNTTLFSPILWALPLGASLVMTTFATLLCDLKK